MVSGNRNGAKQSITTNVRAMNKLLRAAQNAKEELSVGTSVGVNIDEVFDGRHLATSITREQLDIIITPITSKINDLIATILTKSSVSINDVTAIEVFGGSMRMPSIISSLRQRHPSTSIARHIDGDESLVFGAAHYSAVINGVTRATHVTITEEEVLSTGSTSLLSTDEVKLITASLQSWNQREQQRAAIDAARNALESQIIAARDTINGDRLKKQSKELKASGNIYLTASPHHSHMIALPFFLLIF
jgi:molecular chaperone DnaK (HSP70)